MYIADALSMPVHWCYDVAAMKQKYGRVTDYMYAFSAFPLARRPDG
jgi:hypothetical protein